MKKRGPLVQTFTQNPAWLAKALAGNFQKLTAQVGSAYMPKLVEAAASGKRTLVEFKEYGCGAYGCVMPTYDDAVVMKVTTDESEARFVQMGMPWGWPAGITAYFGIMKLEGEYRTPYHSKSNLGWAIWRESATDVGSLDILEPLPEINEDKQLYKERVRVDLLWELIYKTGARLALISFSVGDEWGEIWRDALYHRNGVRLTLDTETRGKKDDWKRWENILAEAQEDIVAVDVATSVEVYQRVIRAMQTSPVTSAVGYALEFYMDRQLLMGDLHTGNFGIVRRERVPTWAITDPGHMIILPTAW